MKKEYDFAKGKRGAVIPNQPGKTRITIRIDTKTLDWFRDQVETAGGGSYQTAINDVLKAHIRSKSEPLAQTLRAVVREELAAYGERSVRPKK